MASSFFVGPRRAEREAAVRPSIGREREREDDDDDDDGDDDGASGGGASGAWDGMGL